MKFSYKARTADGAITNGVIDAHDRADAVATLREGSMVPIVITKQRLVTVSFDISSVLKRVALTEKIIFMKNLAGMLRAGLSISRAIEVLRRQTTNVYFKSILAGLLETIDKGGTLSE